MRLHVLRALRLLPAELLTTSLDPRAAVSRGNLLVGFGGSELTLRAEAEAGHELLVGQRREDQARINVKTIGQRTVTVKLAGQVI